MKGRLEVAGIHELIELQRKIFAKAFQLVKPGGYILWATCSVLKEENQNQIEYFCEHYPVERIKDPFQTIPAIDGPDGFFCQLLQRKK
jgi:16S rRNA (cytosine967-C5)-methyltransferase